jgi:hypothetical protein
MDNKKINLEQQQEVREINIKLNLELTDDFISNKCTLNDYLSLVQEARRYCEEKEAKQYCEEVAKQYYEENFKIYTEEDAKQCCEQATRRLHEPSYRIRPIDAKGNAKN